MLKEAHYQMTFCCEATAKLVELGQLAPTWHMQGGKMQPALALVGMDIYDDRTTLIYLYYCPNCGKKVQVTPKPQLPRFSTQREVVWRGREPGPRSGEYPEDFITRCLSLKPDEDESLITEWATAQYRRLMK